MLRNGSIYALLEKLEMELSTQIEIDALYLSEHMI